MGAAVSNYPLARAVSKLGQLGTVSGVALERVFAMRLLSGDLQGHLRRALEFFPFQDAARRVFNHFYGQGYDQNGLPKIGIPFWTINPSRLLIETTVCANFAHVWLAKEGHENPVSINYLTEIAMPHIYAIYGAMLAHVDWITMGAGIPSQIPSVLTAFSQKQIAEYRVPVECSKIGSYTMRFDPKDIFGHTTRLLKKPKFLPIVSSNLLPRILLKKFAGGIDGFVVEEHTAGGHNARPRKIIYNEIKEPLPIYGPKDDINYSEIADLGLPFWVGGSYASPEGLAKAQKMGARGIQVGTAFALCEESGLDPEIRNTVRRLAFRNELITRTDMNISPAGFPFKVACIPGTLSDESILEKRIRICNQGALRKLYETPNGTIGYRCSAEPVAHYVAKGGRSEDTKKTGCVCNFLMKDIGLGAHCELPMVTIGDKVHEVVKHLMKTESSIYGAKDVIKYILGH